MTDAAFVKIFTWGMGVCATGFFFLIGFIIKFQLQLKDKVSYKWIEEHFQKEIDLKIDGITTIVTQIKDALVGTVDKKGIVTKLHEHGDRLDSIEEKLQ